MIVVIQKYNALTFLLWIRGHDDLKRTANVVRLDCIYLSHRYSQSGWPRDLKRSWLCLCVCAPQWQQSKLYVSQRQEFKTIGPYTICMYILLIKISYSPVFGSQSFSFGQITAKKVIMIILFHISINVINCWPRV